MNSMKLSNDAPINSPNKPPVLAKKSAELWNSIRFDAIKLARLSVTTMRVNDELKKRREQRLIRKF